MKTVLASAYAINPFKGSEDGMGWNFVRQIARFNKVVAITRENNQEAIEQYMKSHPDVIYERIQFVYFDLPYFLRFWKRKSKGALLYFWMWQRTLPWFIRREKLHFDIVHNLNFHNDWTPSYLWKLGKPFVWGPIGHHPRIPSQYLGQHSIKFRLKNHLAGLIKHMCWNYSKDLKKTIAGAKHILYMNPGVPQVLPISETKSSLMPSVACEDHGFMAGSSEGKFRLIAAGRLVPLKGFDLAIRSFAHFLNALSPNLRGQCELLIVGKGPEKDRYIELVKNLGVASYVRFIPWLERAELLALFRKATLTLFPSHEGAGMVVAEALSFGLPVICLDNFGPGKFIDEQSGVAIGHESYEQTVVELSKAIRIFFEDPDKLRAYSLGARQRFEEYFHWDRRGEQLKTIYDQL